jgi:hypothetical protein
MAKREEPKIVIGSRVRRRAHVAAPPEPTIYTVTNIWSTKGKRRLAGLKGKTGPVPVRSLVLVDDGEGTD